MLLCNMQKPLSFNQSSFASISKILSSILHKRLVGPCLVYSLSCFITCFFFQAEEKHCEILGQLLYTAKLVAKQEGLLENGFRLVINDGPSGCLYLASCSPCFQLELHLSVY